MSDLTGYLAPEGFTDDLVKEIGDAVREVHGRLVLADGAERTVAWAANVWRAPLLLPIASIGEGAGKLRAIQRNWAHYSHAHHRRSALIAERLPKVSARPLAFGTAPPAARLGSWTLLAPDTLLAAADCSSPFPHGEAQFVEDRESSPSRAYLKLWEVFTRLGVRPAPGELCLDLGASPGGWTWVLASLGAHVISVDKAALDPRVAAMPGVEARQTSAFGLDPRTVPPVDWLCSDVICYPARLLALVERWLASGTARRYVCSVKFPGETDFAVNNAFKAFPGSQLEHLHYNKHELTWVLVP